MRIISKYIEAHIFRVVNAKIEFLLLKRSKKEIYPGLWQMVTGKIRENETAVETALREIKEETGLSPEKFWVVPNINSFYSKEEDAISLLPVFAAKVTPDAKIKISDEHSEYQWVSPDKAKKLLAWTGQKKSIDIITEYFTKESDLVKFIEIKV